MFNLAAQKLAQALPMNDMGMSQPTDDLGLSELGGGIGGMSEIEDTPDMGMDDKYDLASLSQKMSSDPFATIQKLSDIISPDVELTWTDTQGHQVGGKAEEVLKPDTWNTMDSEKEKAGFLGAVLEALPVEMRAEQMENENMDQLQAEQQTVNIPQSVEASVRASNEEIRKIAQKTKKTPFNLSKTAQSRVGSGNIVHGPTDEMFPSVQQVGNDWHVMERNKGWGKKIDEMYGIDYEMVWRKHIMDKFYREYRDEDGNWVGGYIQKRFEVDKNIPPMNNMQLLPGQKRKPIVAEHGLTEARLESKRVKDGVPGAKVFNWTTANAKQDIKTADLKKKVAYKETQPRDALAPDSGPLKTQKNCKVCNSLCGGNESECHNCGYSFSEQKGVTPTLSPKGVNNLPGQLPFGNNPTPTPQFIQTPKRASTLTNDDNNIVKDDSVEKIKEHQRRRERSFNALAGEPEPKGAVTPIKG